MEKGTCERARRRGGRGADRGARMDSMANANGHTCAGPRAHAHNTHALHRRRAKVGGARASRRSQYFARAWLLLRDLLSTTPSVRWAAQQLLDGAAAAESTAYWAPLLRGGLEGEYRYSGNRNTRSDLKCTFVVVKSMAFDRGF